MKRKFLLLIILVALLTPTNRSQCNDIPREAILMAAISGLIFAKVAYDFYYKEIDRAGKDCVCQNLEYPFSEDLDDEWRKYNPASITNNESENTSATSQDDDAWRDRFYDLGDVFNE